MNCLFCNGRGKNYNLSADIDFVCSRCVLILADADQIDLKRAHAKAIEKGCSNKAKAIELFLDEGEYYGKTKKSERSMERKRPLRTVRPSRDQVRAKQAVV